jgi:hypothetical protein
MNVDELLRFLAPLTAAVLPVLLLIWYRTRRELGEIRSELADSAMCGPCRIRDSRYSSTLRME